MLKDKKNDIVIDNDSVSSRHVEVVYHNGKIILKNLSKTNGIFYNEHNYEKLDLKDTLSIYLGDVLIKLEKINEDVDKTRKIKRPHFTSSRLMREIYFLLFIFFTFQIFIFRVFNFNYDLKESLASTVLIFLSYEGTILLASLVGKLYCDQFYFIDIHRCFYLFGVLVYFLEILEVVLFPVLGTHYTLQSYLSFFIIFILVVSLISEYIFILTKLKRKDIFIRVFSFNLVLLLVLVGVKKYIKKSLHYDLIVYPQMVYYNYTGKSNTFVKTNLFDEKIEILAEDRKVKIEELKEE